MRHPSKSKVCLHQACRILAALLFAVAARMAVASAPSDSLHLTDVEKAWLLQHPVVRVGFDPAWPPFSFRGNNGELQGMDVDMLKVVEQRLGITLVPMTGNNWSEVYAREQSHDLDILSGVALTPERQADLNFTDQYVDFPVAIITRVDGPFSINFVSLEGHLVAAPRDYAPTLILQRDYPKTRLKLTDTVADSMRLVSSGDAFASLDNLASASYIIKEQGLSNLKVAGITNVNFALRYGVRKDWPEFPGILQKVLASISEPEREALKEKWISANLEEWVATHRRQNVLLWVVYVIAASVLLVLLWNWTLAREIRRRKQAEQKLREARNKAIDANRMKSAFMADLSHEIRNPLNAMLGFTELLKRESTDPKQQKYIEAIDSGGRTLLGVINDVLDLSKVEAGHLEIHPMPMDTRGLFRETHALFAQRAALKGIEFTAVVDEAVPPYLMADELRLRQILGNSVSNALKFTLQGSVGLKASFIPSDPKGGNILTLEVIDSGPGIPLDEQKRIFEPFAQRAGQSPGLGGTGLGLAISKRLMELMGGRVELESVPNYGSTFRFVLTHVSSVEIPTAAPAKIKGDLADFKPLRVLVVDDLDFNRELLKEYFERAGHLVWEAPDAEQGVTMARAQPFDLILLDFRLPGMNGRDAARILKADSGTLGIPIVFLSGSISTSSEMALGTDCVVLAKPLSYADLVATLRRLLPHFIKT